MIGHAERLLPALLVVTERFLPAPGPPIPLRILVVQASLVRFAVGAIGRVCRPAPADGAARVTAVGVTPITAAMDVKQGATRPTDDLVKLHPSGVRWIIGPPG